VVWLGLARRPTRPRRLASLGEQVPRLLGQNRIDEDELWADRTEALWDRRARRLYWHRRRVPGDV
jgi:hypothetical protein